MPTIIIIVAFTLLLIPTTIYAEDIFYESKLIKNPGDESFGYGVSLYENKVIISGDSNTLYVFDIFTAKLEKIFRVSDYLNENIIGFDRKVYLENDRLFIQVGLDLNKQSCSYGIAMIDYKSGKLMNLFTDTSLVAFNAEMNNINGIPIYTLKERICSKTFGQFADGIDIDKKYLLVSAPSDKQTQFTGHGNESWIQKSFVFLFDINSGELLKTFEDPDTDAYPFYSDYDRYSTHTPESKILTSFGRSVSLNEKYVVIGAPQTPEYFFDENNQMITSSNHDIGEAYVFDLTSGEFLYSLHGSNSTNSRFGGTVHISGNNVFVSETGYDYGQVFQFDASTGKLLRIIKNPENKSPEFGIYMDSSNDKILISSFYSGGATVPLDRLSAISTEKQDSVVDGIRGKVHMYDISSGNLIRTFKNSDIRPGHVYNYNLWGDMFGFSHSISGDNIVISAPFYKLGSDVSIFVFSPVDPKSTVPKIFTPSDMIITTDDPSGSSVVEYSVSATDHNGNKITPKCIPASGSVFLGVETVTCTATDTAGNEDKASFTVTVVNSIIIPTEQVTPISEDNFDLQVIMGNQVYDLSDTATINFSIDGISTPQNVALEISDPRGTIVISRSFMVDSQGASFDFRIDENFKAGTYKVVATTSDNGNTVTNTAYFKVKSQYNSFKITSVQVTDQQGNPSNLQAGEIGFIKVNLEASKSITTLVTVNLFDSDLTSIGIGSIKTTLSSGNSEIILSFMIPSDVAVGSSNIYVNAFSDWPSNGGIPLTGEISVVENIE